MTNQFFYTDNERLCSLNVNKIIRSITTDDGSLLVLLDDLHERVIETPNINTKTNKMTGVTRKRDVYQTEIYLKGDDITRFQTLTGIL